jgi:single-strand DNA-binding protein
MARSVNKVILVGNLGKDAETKFTAAGTAVSKFSVATTRRFKDNATGDWKDETDWTNIVLWKNEGVAQYLTKGRQVYVEGRLSNRSYEDKDGVKKYITEVVAEEVMLLGGRGEGGEGGGGGGMQSAPRSAAQRVSPSGGGASKPGGNFDDFDPGISDDDVPF